MSRPSLVFLFVALLPWISVASEAAPEATENPAEASPQDQKSGKDLLELEKQIATISAKITAKEASIKDLLIQKQNEKDPEKLSEIIKLLQQEHRELSTLIREHSTQLGVLNYRYPEKGVTQQRKYKRFSSKSLEEMEKSLGLEGHLSRSREKVRKVYGVQSQKPPKGATPKPSADKDSLLNPSTISK
ncbi:MAG: hypothetical protein ACK5Y2_12820 [Bdellovibrionales bacterium]